MVAALLAALAGTATGAVAGRSKPVKITSQGVGDVRIGASFDRVFGAGHVGPLHAGCVLAGPDARAADLAAPLSGTVDFTPSRPRRVMDITVMHGGAARGVGIGGTLREIQAKFRRVIVDHAHEGMFALTFARIPRGAGGDIEFGIDVTTKRIVLIGVPFIATCD